MKLKLFSALLLASGLTLSMAACSKSDDASTTTTSTDTTAVDTTATATPAATDTAAAAGDHATQFLTDAIKGDNAEIRMGQAAQKMGSTQAVKDFGKMLEDDHSKHKDMVSKVATAMNVPVPDGTTPEADSSYKMVTSMSGAGFDKDFAKAMVDDHNKDIAKYQAEADSSDPAQVTDLAKQTLPTLKKHLATAESLNK